LTAPIKVEKALAAIGALFRLGDVIEIRALNVDRSPTFAGSTCSGYFEFEAGEAITKALKQLNNRAEGIYVVLNQINPALLGRAKNRLQVKPKNTTTDADIIKFRWLYIDCDPDRPAGISSTDAEHYAALQRAKQIRAYLTSCGWPQPIYCDSGNGSHLLYLLPDLELGRASELVKGCLKALAHRFSDQVVIVDESTGNASRICKLYGTQTRKGDAMPDRPNRFSCVLEEPERPIPVPVAALEALAAEVATAAPKSAEQRRTSSAGTFNIDEWIITHGLDVVKGPGPYKGGRKWILRFCPFDPTHVKPAIIQLPNGALVYRCLHRSCSEKNWQTLRALIEPGWKPDREGRGLNGCGPNAVWDPPISFHQFDLPQFPTENLPSWMRCFVKALATATQTPADLAGLLALSVIAAACAKKIAVQVKDGYSEPVNIFTVTALPPGNRKTAVFAAVTRPIEEYERLEAKRTVGEVAQAKTAYKIKEACLKRLQEQAVTATGKRREELIRDASALAAELTEMPMAVPTRCIVDDCTSEKLAGLLRDQGGRIAVMSAEGDVFDLMAGRYSAKTTSNFGVYLKGHAGDTLRVDRVGRPPEFVLQPALTVGLAVQPDVIRGLAQKPEFRGRGLLARFLYAVPASLLGHRDTNPPPAPKVVVTDYRNKVLALLHIPFAKDQNGDFCSHMLTLDAGAAERLRHFEAWLEPQLSEFGELGRMTDWGGKIVGAMVRIAGLLHMADLAGADSPWTLPIPEATIERAISLAMYLIPHAKAAFAEMGADENFEKAKAILRWIEHNGLDSFTKRDVHQGTRGTFKRATDLDAPLAVLLERGFIRQREDASTGGPGRHPSPTYEVNPGWTRQNQDCRRDGNSEDCEDSETASSPKGEL
jgi:hypothetical protein